MARKSMVRTSDSFGKIPLLLMVVGTALLAASFWYWWSRIYSSPQRVFNSMLNNSLSTNSFTRDVSRTVQGNLIKEHSTVSLGGQNRSRTVTTVSRGAGPDKASVVTESVGTLEDDYGRYVVIDTNESGPSGNPLDFTNILNIWGKSDEAASGQKNSASFFNEALIGNVIVPVANLKTKDRQAILRQVAEQKVYEVDYSGVKRTKVNGRDVYVYPVSIYPKPYITMMQNLTKNIGLGRVEGLEQGDYEGAAALKVDIVVDILSRNLVGVGYRDGQNSPGRQELYGSHGLRREIPVPKETIPLSDLQQRLQNLQ